MQWGRLSVRLCCLKLEVVLTEQRFRIVSVRNPGAVQLNDRTPNVIRVRP